MTITKVHTGSTVHAGTTPRDDAVVVRIADAPSRTASEIKISPIKALKLAEELIRSANAVLERLAADRSTS